jgi:thiol-disulfide isomerase/thioredoxin
MKRMVFCAASALLVAAVVLMGAGCPKQAAAPTDLGEAPVPAGPPIEEPTDEPPDEVSETPEESSTPEAGEVETAEPPAVQTISHGQEVEIADYAVKGKTTIFDFYSEYCPPCTAFAPVLEELAESREDIALVVVDINRPGRFGIDWGSPVARQYGLESIPHLRVFDANGEEQARGEEARALVLEWVE